MRFERLGMPILFLGLAWAQGTGTPAPGEHSSPGAAGKTDSAPAAEAAKKTDQPATLTITPVPGTAPAVAPSGQMVIEKEVVDVGDVVRGQPATAVFEIRNTGENVLKILEARPG